MSESVLSFVGSNMTAMSVTADIHISTLASFQTIAKKRLLAQRRIFNRLDWWLPQEWFDSQVFWGVGSSSIDAAILINPVSATPQQREMIGDNACAWLRWCAIADDVSASGVLPQLFEHGREALKRLDIRRVYCIAEPAHWIMPYLHDVGFTRVDDVITLVNRASSRVVVGTDSAQRCHIKPADESDLSAVFSVDTAAFAEEWRYPLFVLEKALLSCSYFAVVEVGAHIVGYLFAIISDRDAHITRLAVHPDFQGYGLGTQLLQTAIGALRKDYGVNAISVNTQASNNTSQKLYQKNGFRLLQPTLHVMCMSYGV